MLTVDFQGRRAITLVKKRRNEKVHGSGSSILEKRSNKKH